MGPVLFLAGTAYDDDDDDEYDDNDEQPVFNILEVRINVEHLYELHAQELSIYDRRKIGFPV